MKLSPGALVAALAIGLFVTAPAFAQPKAPAHTQTKQKSADDGGGYVPGAAALEGQIMAPCCWTQTIDIHGSTIANKLKREVRRRLRAGESADSIKADLVRRYGKRILAVPPDSPLKSVAVFMSLAMGLAGIGAVGLLVHWRRRGGEKQGEAEGEGADDSGSSGEPGSEEAGDSDEPEDSDRDDLDARIDDELDRL